MIFGDWNYIISFKKTQFITVKRKIKALFKVRVSVTDRPLRIANNGLQGRTDARPLVYGPRWTQTGENK